MTIQSDRAPLDLFPSENDSGLSVLNATTSKTESAVAARRTVGPAVWPTRTRRRYGYPGDGHSQHDFVAVHQGGPTTARMTDGGRAGVIFTTAAIVACLVVAVVWVTIEPIAIDRTSPPDRASTVDKGTQVQVLAEEDGWLHVRAEPHEGFASADFIRTG